MDSELSNFDFLPDERMCKSASETLDRYIEDFDTTRKLTSSLTCKKAKRSSGRVLNSLRKDMSALDEEIMLARQLFPDESLNSSMDDRSLTTEELLMEHPFNATVRTSTPEERSQSNSMRFSDFQDEDYVYEEHLTHEHKRSSSSLSTTDNTHSNFCAMRTLRGEKRRTSTGYHWSASTTPEAKYMKSKILSEDIKGELTVSMNYQPRSPMQRSTVPDRRRFSLENSLDARLYHQFEKSEELKEDGHISVSLQLEGKPASVQEFMGECFTENAMTSQTRGTRAGERTVESLKNMLFSLQEISKDAKNELGIEGEPGNKEKEKATPGHKSLEKAMEHLVILKRLVKQVGGVTDGGKK